MKNNKILLILLLSQVIYCEASVYDIDNGLVTYTDNSYSMPMLNANRLIINSPQRSVETSGGQEIYSRLGKIVASYDDNYFMTDGVKHCIRLAMDSWEEKITIQKPIRFHVCISESMSPEVAISTTVGYSKKQGVALPDNLCKQDASDENAVNDTIRINASVDWNTSWPYDGYYNGTVNLTNAFLRNIARILGFGTSLVNKSGGVDFAITGVPSGFDRILYAGNTCLSSLANATSHDFDSFFSQDTELRLNGTSYNMSRTHGYIPEVSGLYLSLGYDNIMEGNIVDQLTTLPINKETLDVLKEVGWNVKDNDCTIFCDNTDALGYGSVYKEYNFILKDYSSEERYDAKWKYQLFNPETCLYETVYSVVGNHFCVNPSIDANSMDDYQCMQARIVSEYDEREFSLPLTLEARPMIEDVEVSNYVSVDDQHYQIDINVSQKGATHGTILVSDDTGSVREYNYSDRTITVSNLIKGFPFYVDVTLYNKYGSTNKFIEKESCPSDIANVTGDTPCLTITINGKNVTIPFGEGTPMKILSVDGKVIMSVNLQQGQSLQLPRGIYIIQAFSSNRHITKFFANPI